VSHKDDVDAGDHPLEVIEDHADAPCIDEVGKEKNGHDGQTCKGTVHLISERLLRAECLFWKTKYVPENALLSLSCHMKSAVNVPYAECLNCLTLSSLQS